jgi:hypothetical protein
MDGHPTEIENSFVILLEQSSTVAGEDGRGINSFKIHDLCRTPDGPNLESVALVANKWEESIVWHRMAYSDRHILY